MMSERTNPRDVRVETLCGHGDLLEVTDQDELEIRADAAQRPCFQCQMARETLEAARAGDLNRAQLRARDWVETTLAASDTRTQALLTFLGGITPLARANPGRRAYPWEASELDPNGGDAFDVAEEMIESAVEDLAGEPWRLQNLLALAGPDDKIDVCVVEEYLVRLREAMARVALVLGPFLLERREDLGRLRPGFLTRIYQEGLDYARTRGDDWLPSEGLVALWDRFGHGIVGGKK